MCQACNYRELLEEARLAPTPHRLGVIEVIGNSPSPLTHQEILNHLSGATAINRVTLYRILDLLVEKELVSRISSGDRAFRYGIAPNARHPMHPHFYCRRCGHMRCLDASSLELDPEALKRLRPAEILGIEIRIDGICGECLATRENGAPAIDGSGNPWR